MIDSSLPLTDIHRHLDGNIRAQTILDLGREFNIGSSRNHPRHAASSCPGHQP